MRKLLLLSLLIVGCAKIPDRPPYPGNQPRWQQCHHLYDLHYEFNVLKCEKDFNNPKYLPGQLLKSKKYDKSCNIIIISHWSWNMTPIDELEYSYKVYCHDKPLHDKGCEEGNTLNCPSDKESNFYK